jgi:7-carboxy-7-deazaguanine synthase
MIRIAEIFHSIQGEGILTGMPSVFVRTSGCNLRCRWCDTPYASWKPEGEQHTPVAVFERVVAFKPVRHAVLTGGEPMLSPGLPELCKLLRAAGWHITIETAGTVPPGDLQYDLASLSPKLSGSTPSEAEAGAAWVARHEKQRLQPEVLRQWLSQGDFQMKFVVGERSELGEIQTLLDSVRMEIPPDKVLLMPEGVDPEKLRTAARQVAEWCKQTGFRFCDRLHVHLYGNSRGT